MRDWQFCNILLAVHYQFEIPFPVAHLKKKPGFVLIIGNKYKKQWLALEANQRLTLLHEPSPVSKLKTEKLVLHDIEHYFVKIIFHVVRSKIGKQNRKLNNDLWPQLWSSFWSLPLLLWNRKWNF